MKREVFKKNERVFFTCPCCGEGHNLSVFGMIAYEGREFKCPVCKKTFNFYINQIGKVFTSEEPRIRYIGHIYKIY